MLTQAPAMIRYFIRYSTLTVMPLLFCLATLLTGCTATQINQHSPIQASTPPQTIGAISNLSGRWVNQRGSILEIKEHPGQRISGQFTTAVAKTETCIGYPAPFTGYRNGNAIALSLNMAGCQSPVVIAMTGSVHYNAEGKEMINMLALTQYQGQELWNSRIVTTDFYTRIDPAQ